MTLYSFIDVAPDPVAVGAGIVALIVLFVVGVVILLSAALVIFLWWRKWRRRHVEAMPPANPIQSQSVPR